jgi:hypothetical protein
MSIQIIDNFNLNVAKPIDDRFVVGSQSLYPNVSYNDKNDIPYKYAGLRVWDLDLGVPFYWNGTSWLSENSVSISGSGSASYVPRFVGSGNSTTLGNSNIYIVGNSVGVNNTNPNSLYSLDVIGGINSTSLVSTNGLGIQQLNASNISTGVMSLARLANNNALGWILTSDTSQPNYKDPSTLTVGVSTKSTILNETNDSSIHYVGIFSAYTGNLSPKVSGLSSAINANIKQLTYQPSTGILTSAVIQSGTFSVGRTTGNVGSAATPGINFRSATTTGIYYISNSPVTMGFAVSGVAVMTMESNGGQNGVNFGPQSMFYPRVSSASTSTAALPSYTWYGNVTAGIFRPSSNVVGISTNGIERIRFNDNGVYITSNLDALDSASTTVPLTFVSNPTPGGSPLATTGVLSSTATTYFWFGGPYWYLYLEVESGPGSGSYLSTVRQRSASGDSSPSNYAAVIVPAGCKVRIFIPAIGGANGYYRKFGYA